MKRIILIYLTFMLTCYYCKAASPDWKSKTENADYIHRAIKEITDVMVYDIYSPPVASRTYAYISVAAYETLIHENSTYISLAGQLHGLKPSPEPDKGKEYSYTLAAVHAILTVGKALVISEKKINDFEAAMMEEFKKDGIPSNVFNNSVVYGIKMADHILTWISKDNYNQTRSLPAYTVKEDSASWKPTPPVYIKAVEPHWNKMRTLIIDSAQAFKPVKPPRFSIDTSSQFYKEAMRVYKQGNNNTNEEINIANFWDCNPFNVYQRGHVMYAVKKISPGGHWINITSLVCQKANAGPVESAEAYAWVAITVYDCFIACWDEKYRSVVIRPETYINQYIDQQWRPVLQTPPFPEYVSAHSVISSGASVVLTKLFGKNFSFIDSTELGFGIPPRKFNSFYGASGETGMSRYYGGIHYLPAVNYGLEIGREIGEFFVKKIKTRKNS
ncbi:MAG: vanadium-dependent haloperoxidase [Bacteroidota bacterium]|nr:vanadium-dependent haloperoxidase [Bacteroidota bacterium]